jgi:hypothetical protein
MRDELVATRPQVGASALNQHRTPVQELLTAMLVLSAWRKAMDAHQKPHSSQSPTNTPSGGSSFTEQANEAARKAGETAQQAQSQAREAISNLSSHAVGTMKELLNNQVSTGADFVSDVAHSIHCAADDLNHTAPQLGELAHEAARQVDAFATRMRETPADELFADASDFARRQPAIVFGAAAVLGFAMFRVMRVGAQTSYGSSSAHRQFAQPGEWPQSGRADEVWQNQQFGAAG